MKLPFKYYLHNDSFWELAYWVSDQIDYQIDEALLEKIGEPFYEVTMNCILDTETGEVTLVSAVL